MRKSNFYVGVQSVSWAEYYCCNRWFFYNVILNESPSLYNITLRLTQTVTYTTSSKRTNLWGASAYENLFHYRTRNIHGIYFRKLPLLIWDRGLNYSRILCFSASCLLLVPIVYGENLKVVRDLSMILDRLFTFQHIYWNKKQVPTYKQAQVTLDLKNYKIKQQ